MTTTVSESDRGRLEALCQDASCQDASCQGASCQGASEARARKSRIRIGRGGEGIERAEARFLGRAFAPHRHDTYAIGMTIAGVQRFRYRGAERHCLAGQCHILHPDELHDGAAGTEAGFAYRMIYIDPKLIQDALDGRPLPFVGSPVVEATSLPGGFAGEAWDMDGEVDELSRTEIAVAAAKLLLAASSGGEETPRSLALSRLSRIRDLIAATPSRRHSLDELEHVSGLDRWTIARQFRALFGTSPSRFRTLRQLDEVRRSLGKGASLATASLDAGFADQSHMSRHFKRAYGLTPAAWVAALV
jgi:AraC-like DNA-binding protein